MPLSARLLGVRKQLGIESLEKLLMGGDLRGDEELVELVGRARVAEREQHLPRFDPDFGRERAFRRAQAKLDERVGFFLLRSSVVREQRLREALHRAVLGFRVDDFCLVERGRVKGVAHHRNLLVA